MNSHARITAAPIPVRLGGTTYRMKPLTDGDIAELDQWLKARVIQMARNSLPADASEQDRQATLQAAVAYATTLTWLSGAGAKQMGTIDGMAQIVWQSVHHCHPEVTPEEIRAKLLDPSNADDARATQEAFHQLNSLSGSGDGSKKKSRKKRKQRQR